MHYLIKTTPNQEKVYKLLIKKQCLAKDIVSLK
jgi:hypothetical protein